MGRVLSAMATAAVVLAGADARAQKPVQNKEKIAVFPAYGLVTEDVAALVTAAARKGGAEISPIVPPKRVNKALGGDGGTAAELCMGDVACLATMVQRVGVERGVFCNVELDADVIIVRIKVVTQEAEEKVKVVSGSSAIIETEVSEGVTSALNEILMAGGALSLAALPDAPPPDPLAGAAVGPPPPVVRYIGVAAIGVGVVLAAVGLGFGLRSQSLRDEIQPGADTQNQRDQKFSKAETAASLANILYIAGGAAAAIGRPMAVLDLPWLAAAPTVGVDAGGASATLRWRW